MNAWQRLPGHVWWWLACAGLGAPALLVGWVDMHTPMSAWPDLARALVLQPEAGWQQPPWVWWTCAWLHGGPDHFARNLLALLALAWMGQASGLPRHSAVYLLLAWPLTHLALLATPPITFYLGMSGVLHAGFALVAMHWLIAAPSRPRRTIGALIWAGLAIKLIMENPWQSALIQPSGSDITVAPWAHVTGVLVGTVLGMLSASRGSRAPLI